MAHELEIKDGEAQMAYAGDVPWHGLGTQVDPDLTPKEMMVAAGLDWEVDKTPLFAHLKNPETGETESYRTGKYGLYRKTDNRILTITGEAWTPTQNSEAFEFFNSFHEAGAKMETAGSLFDGQVIWGLAKLGSSFTVGGKEANDVTNGYLLFSLPHKIGQSIQVRTTSTRVVCANTLSWSLKGSTSSEYRQSHMRAFDFNAARDVVEIANERIEQQGIWSNKLLNISFNEADATRFFADLISDESLDDFSEDEEIVNYLRYEASGNSRLGRLHDSYLNAPGAQPGTGWGVLNGVTHYVDHMTSAQPSGRLNSAWFGNGATLKNKTVAKLEEMIA